MPPTYSLYLPDKPTFPRLASHRFSSRGFSLPMPAAKSLRKDGAMDPQIKLHNTENPQNARISSQSDDKKTCGCMSVGPGRCNDRAPNLGNGAPRSSCFDVAQPACCRHVLWRGSHREPYVPQTFHGCGMNQRFKPRGPGPKAGGFNRPISPLKRRKWFLDDMAAVGALESPDPHFCHAPRPIFFARWSR